MSPANVSSFVGDLVEMAKAYEELPAVRHNLEEVGALLEEERKTVQDRELTILKLKQEIEMLNSAKRSLEVERDDAQFHALEADDRTQRALEFIKATFGNAGSLIQALEPPREANLEPVDAPSAMSPNSASGVAGSGEKAEGQRSEEELFKIATEHPDVNERIHANNELADRQGVSVEPSSPSAPEVAASQSPTPSHTTRTDTASIAESPTPSTDQVALEAKMDGDPSPGDFSMPPQAKPYAGKRYSEVIAAGQWPGRKEWEAGGGTIDNWYA